MRHGSNRHRRGIALVWVALLLLMMIGFVGLAIDVARVLWVANQLQNAADAAAMAGALLVREDVAGAQQAPYDCASANVADGATVQLSPNPDNDPNGDVVLGSYIWSTQQFVPTLSDPNAVKVVARRTTDSPGGAVPLFFCQVFGVRTINVVRTAIALSGGGSDSGILILDPDDPGALHLNGTAILSVPDRGIQVNSGDRMAVKTEGGVTIDCSDLDVTGDYRFTGQGDRVTGDISTGARPRLDPLGHLEPPSWDPANDLGTVSISTGETLTLQPGYYSGGISSNGGTLNLEPGIYILDGVGLYFRGNGDFIARGVMLYIIGTGSVDMAGTGAMYLTPPDRNLYAYPEARVYEGISIFQARTNTNPSRIIGTSGMDLNGTLYFPSAALEMGGTGGSFGNALISATLDISGTGNVTIDYDEDYPSPWGSCYLVR